MGRSQAPSAGQYILPAPAAPPPAPTPQVVRSMVPLESYQMAGDFLRRIQEETRRIEQQRFDEVGTPAEIGARQAARDVATAAEIEASIPTGDRYLTETTGRSNQFEPARTAARQQRTQAEAARAVALARAATRGRPQAPVTETPSWAQRTV